MNAERIFKEGFTGSEKRELRAKGVSGVTRVGNFSADFLSINERSFSVKLKSAGVWIGVQSRDEDYVLFVEQADRILPNGTHPWEVPSGGVDTGRDKNIYMTADMEVFEETGIRLRKLKTIAIAVKRVQNDIPPQEFILPVFDNELWIDNEERIMKMAEEGPLEGGLIGFSLVPLQFVPGFSTTTPSPYSKDGRMYLPPAGVDRTEISRIALEILDDVMERKSPLLNMSAHMWAQADAFRAFILNVGSVKSEAV